MTDRRSDVRQTARKTWIWSGGATRVTAGLSAILLASAVAAGGAAAQQAASATRGIAGYGYELVSPVSTKAQTAYAVDVDPTGSQVLYFSGGGFSDVGNLMNIGATYRATRTDSGWVTEALGGPPASDYRTYGDVDWMPDWWQDDRPLSMWPAEPIDALGTARIQAMVGRKGGDWTPISPMADLDVTATDTQFRRVLLSGSGRPALTDGSTDGRAASRSSLYVAQAGPGGLFDVRQVAREGNAAQFTTCTVRPGGSAGGITRGAVRRADLSRIIYTTIGCNQTARQRVWVSEPFGPTPQAYDISAPQCTGCGAQQRVEFVGASLDSERVYMTTTQRLVDADTNGSTDLYEYDFRRPSNRLQLISASGSDANVLGVLNVSDTGSHVYFVARGPLSGVQLDRERPGPVDGAPNLYVRVSGDSGQNPVTRFVGTLDEADSALWSPAGAAMTALDGRIIAFASSARLTPDKLVGDDHPDVYRYDAQSGELRRVWVGDPAHNGSARSSGSVIAGELRQDVYANQARGLRRAAMASDGNRILFDTAEPLVGGDDNGAKDYFLWDADDGSLAMVSDGKDPQGPDSAALSPDGQTVFVGTSSRLAPQHTATSVGLFAYRPGGGFPLEDVADDVCNGDACQGTLPGAPPPLGGVGSNTFGVGNDVPLVPTAPVLRVVGGRSVRGTTVSLRVRSSSSGSVRVSGRGIRTATRALARTGTYTVQVRLSAAGTKNLKRKGRVTVSARVRLSGEDGATATTRVALTYTSKRRSPRTKPKPRASARVATGSGR